MEDACEDERAGSREVEQEKEVWRCLNSVHDLLRRREVLNQTLRQGWMELVSARYEMGPARISYPLFSLKPHAGNAVVDVRMDTLVPEDNNQLSDQGHAVFDLVMDRSERERQSAAGPKGPYTSLNKEKPPSQLRRRVVSTSADTEKDELLEYSNLISDSDSDEDLKPLQVPKSSLQGFGAIVSPHLRSAQGTFSRALQLVMELLNSQSEAVDAHIKVSNLQASLAAMYQTGDSEELIE